MDSRADHRPHAERIGATPARAPVVVGVDGGTDSLDAVRWAAAQARLRGVALRIVHTAGWSSDGVAARGRGPRADLGAAFTAARRAQPGLSVSTGPPTTDRCAPAGAGEDAQLLVLGSGDGLRSAALVLDAPGGAAHPVAVVRGRAGADDGPVLVGVGDPQTDAVVLAVAFAEAELRNCPLLVVHALGAPLGHPAGSGNATVRLAEAVGALTEQRPSVGTRIRLVPGAATRALLTAAHDARIVVIGARRHGSRSLGRELLRRSPVPVLLVPPGSRTPRPAHPAGPAGVGRRRGSVGDRAHDGDEAVAVLHGVRPPGPRRP